MYKTIVLASFLAVALFSVGCGTGTPPCDCPAPFHADVYAAGNNGEIAAFPINGTFAPGTPVTIPGPAASLGMVQTADEFLYASNPQAEGGGSIDAWTINVPTGSLTTVAGSPFVLGPSAMPSGLAVAPTVALLTPNGPGGAFLYVADAGTIDALQVNSGALTAVPGSPFTSGTNRYLTVDPLSRFVFAADEDPPGGVFAFSIGIDTSAGVLTPVPGSPFLIGTDSNPVQTGEIVVDTSGSFVYVTLPAAAEVAGFSIDAASGLLTPVPGSPFPAGSGAFAIAVNNAPGVNSRYVYVANQTANSISGYSINATTGALTPLASSPFRASGVTALVTDSLDHLYVYGSSGMMVFSIDPNSGALAPIGSPIVFSGATVLAYVGG